MQRVLYILNNRKDFDNKHYNQPLPKGRFTAAITTERNGGHDVSYESRKLS